MNSAKKLLQFNFDADAFTRRALKPISIPRERLEVLKKIINDHSGQGSGPPIQENLREIYRLFIDTPSSNLRNEFNTLRRIRLLAWALTFSEDGLPRIVDIPKLKDALQIIENRYRISALRGVFKTLLEAWDSPNANILRAFVKKHLTDYNGNQKFVQKLKTNITWYCEENSATQLATTLFRSQVKLSGVWSFLDLEASKNEYMYRYSYFGSVAIAYVSIGSPNNIEFVKDVVEFVKKHNNDKTSRTVLSKLIQQLGNDASEDLRQPIQSYVLQKWGDPRLAGSNWGNVADEARKIFTKWITEEDLRFFFDAVARSCNDQNFEFRREFWLAYLEHISFCRPVLRRNAESLFRHNPQTLHYYRVRRPATLKGGNSDQHAFIIQMGNYTFIEFSTGAACYVYDNGNLPFSLDKENYNLNELRRTDLKRNYHTYTPPLKHWQPHNGSENYAWQRVFVRWIEKEIGFVPVRSYRLHAQDEIEDNQNPKVIEKRSINCPNKNCMQKLHIPVTEDQLRITCPTCRTTFEY